MLEFHFVPDPELLAELPGRLARHVLSPPTPMRHGGLSRERLDALIARWSDGYDHAARLAELDAIPQRISDLDGLVHWAELPGRKDAPTIVLTHGWPYSFVEMLPLARELQGDFRVVVPSLPGYLHSASRAEPFTTTTVAELWHRLLRDDVGVDRYLVYGEDVGAGVSDRLAVLHPEAVAAIVAPHAAFPPQERKNDLTAEERDFDTWLDGVWADGRGYSQIQSTRPDTVAVGLADSPVGLLAWIAEKFDEWSDGGVPDDAILTTVLLYWLTRSIGTSFRAYSEDDLEDPLPTVDVPAAVLVQQHERRFPRSYAERTYTDLRSFRRLERGGHFTALEAPADVAVTLRELASEVGMLRS